MSKKEELDLTLEDIKEEEEAGFEFYIDDEMEDLMNRSIPSTPNS